ncbi:RING finger protein 228-like [Halichoeres trimaculatus]|uniref:RING finger protein 228-like n=1 Tax=Halichoeres trimaculatus TaxID=147232 RepID=UPI003D9F4203
MAEVDTEGAECVSDSPGGFPGEEYECKICYNDFDLDLHIPKLLGCSHTFCKQCLHTLHSREGRGWRIGCPICRHRTPVPEYRVDNLPDNTALCDALPLNTHERVNSSRTEVLVTGPTVSSAVPHESNDGCLVCKQVAFMTGCACAIFSFLSMVVLLFMGLIFVHNFNNPKSPVGPICLFVASILALFSIIFTWIVCMVKYRPETEGSNFNSLTSNVM